MKKLLTFGGAFAFALALSSVSAKAQGAPVNSDGWTCTSACTSHTLAHAAASGDLVVVMCNGFSSGSCNGSMTSSPSYTWTCDDTGTNLSFCYICPGTNTSGVTSVTFSTSGAAVLAEAEVSSIVSTSCKDVSNNGNENGGSTWVTASITRTNARDFVLAINESNVSASGMTISSPYTNIVTYQGTTGGTNLMGYNDFTSTGSGTAGGNQPTGSSDGFADIIAFKALQQTGGCSSPPALSLLGVSRCKG